MSMKELKDRLATIEAQERDLKTSAESDIRAYRYKCNIPVKSLLAALSAEEDRYSTRGLTVYQIVRIIDSIILDSEEE